MRFAISQIQTYQKEAEIKEIERLKRESEALSLHQEQAEQADQETDDQSDSSDEETKEFEISESLVIENSQDENSQSYCEISETAENFRNWIGDHEHQMPVVIKLPEIIEELFEMEELKKEQKLEEPIKGNCSVQITIDSNESGIDYKQSSHESPKPVQSESKKKSLEKILQASMADEFRAQHPSPNYKAKNWTSKKKVTKALVKPSSLKKVTEVPDCLPQTTCYQDSSLSRSSDKATILESQDLADKDSCDSVRLDLNVFSMQIL